MRAATIATASTSAKRVRPGLGLVVAAAFIKSHKAISPLVWVMGDMILSDALCPVGDARLSVPLCG